MSTTISAAAGLVDGTSPPLPDFVTVVHGAESPEQLTRDEVVWSFFQYIHFKEQRRPGSALPFLEKNVPMSADAARSLVAYALDSYAQNAALMDTQIAKVCDDFANGRLGSLSDRMAAEDMISDSFQRSRIVQLKEVLDARTQSRLDTWLGRRFAPSFSVVRIDSERMLRQPGAAEAITEQIRELCSEGQSDVDNAAPE